MGVIRKDDTKLGPMEQVLALLNERMNRGTEEVNQMQREIRDISTNQTKISGDLVRHIEQTDLKHNQIMEKFDGFSKSLDSHTKDEMDMQEGFKDAIDSINRKLHDNDFKTKIIWGIVTTIGSLSLGAIGYGIKLVLDNLATASGVK